MGFQATESFLDIKKFHITAFGAAQVAFDLLRDIEHWAFQVQISRVVSACTLQFFALIQDAIRWIACSNCVEY